MFFSPEMGKIYVKIYNISDPCFHELSFQEICVSSDKTFLEDSPISRKILAEQNRDLAYVTQSFLYRGAFFAHENIMVYHLNMKLTIGEFQAFSRWSKFPHFEMFRRNF